MLHSIERVLKAGPNEAVVIAIDGGSKDAFIILSSLILQMIVEKYGNPIQSWGEMFDFLFICNSRNQHK